MIGHFKLQAQNVTGSWDEAGSLASLVYAIGLKRRPLFCSKSIKKESRNLLCVLPLRLSQSENALAEISLSVVGITHGLKNPPPHSFLNFETRSSNIII